MRSLSVHGVIAIHRGEIVLKNPEQLRTVAQKS
jgi:hypothetical protein